jgi:hypothetical protein
MPGVVPGVVTPGVVPGVVTTGVVPGVVTTGRIYNRVLESCGDPKEPLLTVRRLIAC